MGALGWGLWCCLTLLASPVVARGELSATADVVVNEGNHMRRVRIDMYVNPRNLLTVPQVANGEVRFVLVSILPADAPKVASARWLWGVWFSVSPVQALCV
jgi:hypothetical protein